MKIKTSEAVANYNLINPAKLTKMTDSKAKFAIIKDNRALKKVAEDYDGIRNDTLEKLKGVDFGAWQEKAQKWQGKTATTPEEQQEVGEINNYFYAYQSEVDKCLGGELAKERDIEIEKISDEQFQLFADSNDWTVEQTGELYGLLVE